MTELLAVSTRRACATTHIRVRWLCQVWGRVEGKGRAGSQHQLHKSRVLTGK